MKNGHDPNWSDPKVASISAARKKAEDAKRRAAGPVPARNVKDLLIGAVIVAMAVGFLVHLARPLWQGALEIAR